MTTQTTRLLYDNYGLGASWTASSAVPTLPASNLARAERRRVCRTVGAAAEWFAADLGVTRTVDGLALVDANLTPAATITIEASPSDAWPGVFSASLTPWAAGDSGVLLWFLLTPQSYRWWRLSIADPSNPSGYIEIGVAMLSPRFDFLTRPGASSSPSRFTLVDPSLVEASPIGTPYSFDLPSRWEVDVPFGALDESLVYPAFLAALRAMGRRRDGVLSARADAPSGSPAAIERNLYGRFVDVPDLSYTDSRYYQTALRFRESR